MDSNENFILKLRPLHKALISLAVALAIAIPLYLNGMEGLLVGIYGWLGFSVIYLTLSWIIIFKRKVEQIKQQAKKDDGSVAFVFVSILFSSFASMVAVLMMVTSKDKIIEDHFLNLPATVLAMIMAWFMIQTQYIFHYAHEYYDDDSAEGEELNGGLDFPNDDKPDYLDFAYYSFCMGCTFQVSDVDITSKIIRRITMVHGLLAFFMNTFVVALTINLVAGMSE